MKNLILLLCLTLFLTVFAFAQKGIRDVDFKNFTYQPDFCGGEDEKDKSKITVKDGEYSEETKVGQGEDAYMERLYFNIFDIAYGDLYGDKKDEAIIISVCNTGGTGNFTEAYIYKLQNGKPVRVMVLGGGDRADGGLRETRVENGLLVVESNGTGEFGGACCPEYIITNIYKFDGKQLKEVGKEQKREIYPATRIAFDRGRSSKTVSVKLNSDEGIKRFVVGAAKGQVLTVTKDTTDDAYISLRKGEAEVLQEDKSLIAKLNETGDFVFELSISSAKNLDFSITVTIKNAGDVTLNSGGKIESIYSDLSDKKCKTLESNPDEGGSYRGECDGVGNYKLEFLEGDLRQSINVVHKQSGDKWELDLWSNVSGAFSYLGEKAEWRVKNVNGKIQPVALIVRFNASENPDNPEKVTSYLVVTKFDGEFVCITDIVKPMAKQNEKARELADVAASKPCFQRK